MIVYFLQSAVHDGKQFSCAVVMYRSANANANDNAIRPFYANGIMPHSATVHNLA